MRALSRIAFRQDYRLELMLAIADASDGTVCLTDLARTLGTSASNLQVPLKNLIDLGLLSPLPRGEDRRKFYLRNKSAAWAWARELSHAAVTSQ